jgi:hypothetical protein
MVYEDELCMDLPFGPTHLVYLSDDFEADIVRFRIAGAFAIREPIEISAQFGQRKVAFFQSPSGWIFEIALIHTHGVPEVS